MHTEFKWEEASTKDLGITFIPCVILKIKDKKNKYFDIQFLFDTGSPITIVKHNIGSSIVDNIQNGKEIVLSGLGGKKIICFLHQAKILWNAVSLEIPMQ